MSVEQVARDVVMNMTKLDKVKTMVTADAMASGGLLQKEIPITESLKVTAGLITAFPDFRIEIQKLTVDGDRAWVKVRWSGTQTGPLSLPGMPTIPATRKKVSVEDAYVVTVRGDKVSHFEIQSPADGGIPAAIAQLGVKMPAM
jgi:predicted ester cyclase